MIFLSNILSLMCLITGCQQSLRNLAGITRNMSSNRLTNREQRAALRQHTWRKKGDFIQS
ncbi:hypothetical protein AUM41_12095 [Cronobacter malonaticus]|uniref:Uncharacterized protein n=2 Tax=Cronobacter malonaticus TaxID=413503 RepID=A0A423Y4F3_9ENTR|nr:hypothetical protein [Cronobacter malonaticus]EGT4372268.1 hypothetical protein [Cronobacter malonaticus]EGT4383841.1 hypothetical protein [Cronobacter malonaticus]EGT4422369.1 hypothetical protein [Cronobacter malonaticus]EGT4445639.1 hypothetical protein [Cronobacter malonaticus]